jgi:hypothetical protein
MLLIYSQKIIIHKLNSNFISKNFKVQKNKDFNLWVRFKLFRVRIEFKLESISNFQKLESIS